MSCPLDMLFDRVRTTVHYHLKSNSGWSRTKMLTLECAFVLSAVHL